MATAEEVLTSMSESPPPASKRTGRNRKRGGFSRIPTSSIINFSALILLFVSIMLLQQFGGRFSSPPGKTATAIPSAPETVAIPESAAPTIAQTAETQTPAAAAEAVPRERIASVGVALAVPPPPVDEPLPPSVTKQPMTEPAPSAPSAMLIEQPTTRILSTKRRPEAREESFAQRELERETSVEELDGEPARQAYLAANRTPRREPPPSAVAPTASAATLPVPSPPEASAPDDFIPFERR